MPKKSPYDTWVCNAIGCEKSIPIDYLMCRRHWFLVPLDVRKVIMATWIAGPMFEYQAAKKQAIEAVAAKEEGRHL